MSIGLALSGGGSKGAAHIGVLKALEDSNIHIDYISGTSSGSIIAALYACGYKPSELLSFFNMYCNQIGDYDKLVPLKLMSTVFTGKIGVKGLAKGEKLEYIINNFCLRKNISDISQLKFPLAIPTVDINSGAVLYFMSKKIYEKEDKEKSKVFDDSPTYVYNGKLSAIVRASSSFPGVFEPKMLNGRILVDGGVRVNTPISILRKMGADNVIAISFDKNKKYTDNNLNVVSVSLKAFDIMGHQVNEYELNSSDLIIRPDIPGNISLLDCRKTNLLTKIGYEATIKLINNIEELI